MNRYPEKSQLKKSKAPMWILQRSSCSTAIPAPHPTHSHPILPCGKWHACLWLGRDAKLRQSDGIWTLQFLIKLENLELASFQIFDFYIQLAQVPLQRSKRQGWTVAGSTDPTDDSYKGFCTHELVGHRIESVQSCVHCQVIQMMHFRHQDVAVLAWFMLIANLHASLM